MIVKKKLKSFLFLFFIIIIGIAIRFIYLESDPPEFISFSAAIYADEGYKALDAHNYHFWGTSHSVPGDEYGGHTRNYTIYKLQKSLFSQFGFGLYNLRFAHVLLAITTLFIWYLWSSLKQSKRFKYLFALILALHPVSVFYSRLAFYEFPLLFSWLISIIPFILMLKYLHEQKKVFFWGITGVAFFTFLFPTCMGIKSSYLLLTGQTFVALLGTLCLRNQLFHQKIKNFFKKRFSISISILGVFSIYLLVYTIQPASFTGRFIAGPLKLFSKLFFHHFTSIQPISLLLAFFGGGQIIYHSLDSNRSITTSKPIEIFISLLFYFGFFTTWLFSYDPTRYYLLSLLPQLYLTAYSLNLLFKKDTQRLHYWKKSHPLFFWSISTYLGFLILNCIRRIFSNHKSWATLKSNLQSSIDSNTILTITIGLISLIAIIFITRWVRNKTSKTFLGKRLALIIIAGYIAFFINFLVYKTTEIQKAENFLKKNTKKNEIIAGDWAPIIAFNLPLKAIYSCFRNKNQNVNNLNSLKPTYIIANDLHNETKKYNDRLPKNNRLKNGKEIYRFRLGKHNMGIWKLKWR